MFPPILQLHLKSLYFLSKHSNLEPKHGLLRVGTTYAGFYLKLNILWQKSTNRADPDLPCEESIPHFPWKRSPTPPWGKQIQTMPPMLQTGPIPILSNPYGAKWMENLKWPHLYLWLGWWQRDRGCTAQVITLLIL